MRLLRRIRARGRRTAARTARPRGSGAGRWGPASDRAGCGAEPHVTMKPESIAFAIAGVVFGLIAGFVMGYQKGTIDTPASSVAQTRPAQPAAARRRRPCSTKPRSRPTSRSPTASRRMPRRASQLGNLYFDAERYDEAIRWYSRRAQDQREGRRRQHRSGRVVLLREPAGQGARAVRSVAEARPQARQDAS